MKLLISSRRHDFEGLGYKTALETGDPIAAQKICWLHLESLQDELQPEMSRLVSELVGLRQRAAALWSYLYDRPEPVSDAAMLACTTVVGTLTVLLVAVAAVSIASGTVTLYLFGAPLILSLILGIALTGVSGAIGHQLFEKIVSRHKALEAGIICASFLLCYWGLVELNQARTLMADKAAETSAAETSSSYVSEPPDAASSEDSRQESHVDEREVRSILGSAVLKIMLATDAMLGIFLGIILSIWHKEIYVAWRTLKKVSHQTAECEARQNEILAMIETAKKQCIAGILRATKTVKKKHVPYHQLTVLALALLVTALPAFAQDLSRHEGILLDVSGSIGKGGANSELFQEYLASIKNLLASEPPKSRVWVSVISTDSFGSVRELLRGWTPDKQGVFTDDLNRARHQLASNFQSRATSLRPLAAGTDIIGGLWHLKALLESGTAAAHVSKEIWIFSDMVNETAELPIPALVATGPEGMLQHAKARGLIVPLSGYKIYVCGASPSGLRPEAWTAIKKFWTMYFQAAGAELVTYSAESEAQR